MHLMLEYKIDIGGLLKNGESDETRLNVQPLEVQRYCLTTTTNCNSQPVGKSLSRMFDSNYDLWVVVGLMALLSYSASNHTESCVLLTLNYPSMTY